jgi:hypothetical protein
VLVAPHVQRSKPDKESGPPAQGRRTASRPTAGPMVTRHGRPSQPRQDAPVDAGPKAKPLRGRPTGRALTPVS